MSEQGSGKRRTILWIVIFVVVVVLLLLMLRGCGQGVPVPEPGGQEAGGPVETTDVAGNKGFLEVKATVDFEEFGTLFVHAVADFVKYAVLDKAGKEWGKGDTRITTMLLPVGEYEVNFTIAGKEFSEPITVTRKGTTGPGTNLKTFGRLSVSADEAFKKFVVKDSEGNDVAGGDTQITDVLLPKGTFTVHCLGQENPLTIEGGDDKRLMF